jgi:glutaredoxin-like protein NrdH
MTKQYVKGEDKGKIFLFALSTCGWCRKTKKLLNELGVEYYFVDVDLLKGEHRDETMKELEGYNPRCTFPTLVINDQCIVGFKEDKIKEALEA